MYTRLVRMAGLVWMGLLSYSLARPVAAGSPGSVQDDLKPPYELWQALQRKTNRQLLTPLVTLQARAEKYLASSTWRSDFCQMYATELSLTGRDREAIRYFDQVHPPGVFQPADLRGFRPEDAVAVITALAAERTVVMINEAHHAPQHRLTTLLLLESLKRQGYRYFAAETLDVRDQRLQARRYPTIATGFYTLEPLYGELVRTALRLGYKVIPYEYVGADPSPAAKADAVRSIEEREEGEARNLRDRIFASDPKAKVLIHAGYDHIAKLPLGWKKDDGTTAQIPWMAARFARLTGIDPLVVDQTHLMEHSDPARNHPIYLEAVANGWLKDRPIVLRHPDTKQALVPLKDRGKLDLVVLHPPVQEEQGRPTWLKLAGRRLVSVPEAPAAPPGGMLLLQAFYPKEDAEQAIPADQIAYGTGDPRPALVLPAGSFRTRVVDADGKVVFEGTLTVP